MLFVYFVFILGMAINGSEGIVLNSYSACYGVTLKNIIIAGCDEGEFIVIESLYSYAKPIVDNCPETMMSSTTPDSCCQYKDGDCGTIYSGVSKSQYYDNCQNRNKCKATQVSWEPAPCNTTVYMSRTNYMVLYYYCIKSDNNVLSAGSNATVSGQTVLLQNEGYHLSSQQTTSIKCLVETSCITNIQVLALDLQMDETDTNSCPHEVKLSSNGNTKSFHCNDIDNINVSTVIYTSNGPRMTLQLLTQPSNSIFKYLFTFFGVYENATVSIGCNLEGDTLTNKLIPDCPSEHSATTTEETTTTEKPTTTEETTTKKTTATELPTTSTTLMATAEPGVIKQGEEATVVGQVVWLINSAYPSLSNTGAMNYSCSAVASCQTGIQVSSLSFTLSKDADGTCRQVVNFRSLSSSSSFDCDKTSASFTSSTPSLILDFVSYNADSTGKFKFEIKAMLEANISLVCSNTKQVLSTETLPNCAGYTTPTTVLTSSEAQGDKSGQVATDPPDEATETWKWLVPVVLVLVFLVLLIVCLLNRDRVTDCICRRKEEDVLESDEEEITDKPFDKADHIEPNGVAPRHYATVAPRALKPQAHIVTAANTVAAAVKLKKKEHRRKKKEKLYIKEKELIRRESEVEIKESKLKQKQEELSRREAKLLLSAATKWSEYSQRKAENSNPYLEEESYTTTPARRFFQNYKHRKAAKYQVQPEPDPPHIEEFTREVANQGSSNVQGIERKVSLQTLFTAVSAFTPKKSTSVCIDLSNEDGEFIDSKIYETSS